MTRGNRFYCANTIMVVIKPVRGTKTKWWCTEAEPDNRTTWVVFDTYWIQKYGVYN